MTTWLSIFCFIIVLYKCSLFHYSFTKSNDVSFYSVAFLNLYLFDFRNDLFLKAIL